MSASLHFRAEAPVTAPALPLAEFLAASNATAVRLDPADDARALLPFLDRLALVEVAFPAFRDGRGYSSARILRESGYTGELRAAGDVLVDQLAYMRRAGFDSFAPAAPIDGAAAKRALARYPAAYQRAADGQSPIWAHRHG
jgi:uncharacterized protein (DUF934 family)